MKLLASTLATVALGHASNDICPSNFVDGNDASGCYKQVGTWDAGNNNAEQLSCEMSNPQCLVVECFGTRMKASLRYDLFQTNGKHDGSFGDQLLAGTRKLFYNGNELSATGSCGFTVDEANGMINLDWSYTDCKFSPTIDADDKLVFTIALSSPGNAPGIPDIEFYVNTDVTAQCKYDTDIKLDHSFWVNQEDTEAGDNNLGKFTELFNCEFFNDKGYENVIGNENIVNMGQTIYGKASALLKMPGLKYTLTGVVVSDASGQLDGEDGEPKSFDVIGPVGESEAIPMSKDVDAQWVNQSTGSAPTEPGSDIEFSYLSFGFEDLEHQNKLKVECNIKVEKADEVADKTVKVRFVSDHYEIGDWYTLGPIEGVATHSFSLGVTPTVTIKSGSEVKFEVPAVSLESNDEYTFGPYKFEDGDEMIFDHSKDINGVGLKRVELIICDEGDVNCKTRVVKMNGLESFWFNDVENWAGSKPGYWGCTDGPKTYTFSHSYLGPAVAAENAGDLTIPAAYHEGSFDIECGNYAYALEAQLLEWTGVTSTYCATTANLFLNYADSNEVALTRTYPCAGN